MSETPKVGNPEREPANHFDNGLQPIRQDIRGAAAETGSQPSEATSRLRDEAAAAVADVKAEAAGVVEAARERATGFAEQQKVAGAQYAEVVARAVHRAADELQDTSPQIASYVREAGASVRQVAQTIRERSVQDVVGEVQGIARQQPIAFFGAAVLAGFALSRFVKSSAEGLAARGEGRTHTGSAGMTTSPPSASDQWRKPAPEFRSTADELIKPAAGASQTGTLGEQL